MAKVLLSSKIKKIISIIAIVSIALMVLPIVISSAYSMLVYDDINHGLCVGAFNVSIFEYIWASIKYSIYAYKTFSGTFFAMFIQALLSPINNGGLVQLRIEMVLIVTCFFASLFFFLSTITKKINGENKYCKYIAIAVLIFMITGFNIYDEIFYWFSGTASYTIPIIFALLGATFYIKMNQGFKKRYMAIAMIFGFLSSGGSLMVAGTWCYIILLITLFYFLKDKTHHIKNYVVFGAWLLGAIVNVIAPGNYLRHDMIDDTGIHLTQSIKNTFSMVFDRYVFFTSETCFIALIIIVIICGIIAAPMIKSSKKNLVLATVPSILLPFVTAFPYTLGYSIEWITNRFLFMTDFSFILSSCAIFFVAGIVIEKYIQKKKKLVGAVMLVAAMAVALIDGFSIKDNKITPIITDLIGGYYQEHEEQYQELLSIFENAEKGSDLTIYKDDLPFEMKGIANFWLSADKDNFVNQSFAEYYGLNSIIYIKE